MRHKRQSLCAARVHNLQHSVVSTTSWYAGRGMRLSHIYAARQMEAHTTPEETMQGREWHRCAQPSPPGGFFVAFADLCRDRPCKQPKGQALFFLVDHGHPELLSALGAEELRDILEGTMLEACVGV